MPIASPIMVTTLPSRLDTGMRLASTKAMPRETVVVASPVSSGRLAATNVPNATRSIASVSGSARFSARAPPEALQVLTSKSAAGVPVTARLAAGSSRTSAAVRAGSAERTVTTVCWRALLLSLAGPTRSTVTCPSAERSRASWVSA